MPHSLRLLLLPLFAMVFSFVSQSALGQATVTSDKDDYAPRSNAVFTGSGFRAFENVQLKVKNLNRPCNTVTADSSYLPWTVTADANGDFITNWTVCDCLGDSLRLKATGLTSGLYAYAYFTDGSLSNFNIGSQALIPKAGTSTEVSYSASISIAANKSGNTDLTSTINLSASNLPNGVSFISPASISVTGNVTHTFTIKLKTSTTTPVLSSPGQSFTITATTPHNNGSSTTSTTGTLIVDKSVNNAPVLNSIGNKNIDELKTLSFTATGTDADVLTFSLANPMAGNFPTGATITTNGSFSWTPTEEQGGETYRVKIIVSDGSLTDEEEISITVAEVNSAPVLTLPTIASTINELVALSFTASAVDADRPNNGLTYSLVGAPTGASIDAATGVFTWTPAENQDGAHSFKVRVTDDGTGALYDEKTVSVTVAEVNSAPVLTLPSLGLSKAWGETMTFTASASDDDRPVNTLTYSLEDAPTGATINGLSGMFSWIPTSSQIGSFTFKVKATDNGSPVLSDEKQITLTVTKRGTIIVYSGDNTKQYSDRPTLTATLEDAISGEVLNLNDKKLRFTIGTQYIDVMTTAGVANTTGLQINQPIVSTNVVVRFIGSDANLTDNVDDADALYTTSINITPFNITLEDADIVYSGSEYFSTASSTSKDAKIALSATVTDKADHNTERGDIKNSNVGFILINGSGITGLQSGLSVGYVNSSDPTLGTATLQCVAALSDRDASQGGTTYTIRSQVGGNYYKPVYQDQIITVVVPGQDFVTGGGNLVLTNSSGQYGGTGTSRMNFGFNMKWNSSGKNLMGQITIHYRKWETSKVNGVEQEGWHVYKIKSNAINSMSIVNVTIDGVVYRKAVISTKANLERELPNGTVESLGGNKDLSLDVLENSKITNGSMDRIGVTLREPSKTTAGGGVLFSSSWSVNKTVDQQITGGKINVRGTSVVVPSTSATVQQVAASAPQVDVAPTATFSLTAFPNPSANHFNVKLESSNSTEKIVVRVIDLQGRTVQVFNNLVAGQTLQIGSNFRPGMYFVEMIQGNNRKQLQLVKRIY